MQLFATRERVALGFGPDRVRLLVAKANGKLEARHADSAELPAGALRTGLRAPTLANRDAVIEALRELVRRARAARRLRRPPELAAVVLFDGAVKMALAPLEGETPDRQEGERMARWVLRELLPGEAASLRVDWSLVGGGHGDSVAAGAEPGEGGGAFAGERRHPSLFSVGAQEELVREYEGLVEELGWEPGRVVPWTLAAAAALQQDADRTLLLCEGDGALASAFEDGGVISFHRAWRARVATEQLGSELVSLRRYVAEHLDTTIASAVTCGPEAWQAGAAAACATAGLAARPLTPEQALLGAVRG